MPTLTRAAIEINTSNDALRDLIALGYLNGSRPGHAYDIPQAEVDRLATIPYVTEPHSSALVVSVEPARKENDQSNGRAFVGWTPKKGAFSEVQVQGVTKWWQAQNPDTVEVVVVTRHGWILHAYEVDGEPIHHESRAEWHFPVTLHDTDKTRPFLEHRLPPRPGPLAYTLPARP
ncbi:hypothetical protein GALL_383440 [mine drainage metagenome]|uniref:Uncharacterized protein n=1 Tax=mine drainage metagenome TaxID=410659 RepID=A0A1J5QIY9_9ZZZZ